jgi:hypothetical protein
MLQIAYSERLQAVPAWRPGGTQINHSAAEWQLAAETRNVVHNGGYRPRHADTAATIRDGSQGIWRLRSQPSNHPGDHPQRGPDVRTTGRRWTLAHRTSRLHGAIKRSRNVGGHGRIWHLAASTVARSRPASVTVCLRWLPVWLPASGDPAVIGLHTCGCADSSSSSRLLRVSRTRTIAALVRSSPRTRAGRERSAGRRPPFRGYPVP